MKKQSALLLLFLSGYPMARGDVSTSNDYQAVHQLDVTAGQQVSGSSDYQVLAVVGGSAALGRSDYYTAVAGISSGLFNVNGLTIGTDPTQLPEGSTATVSGLATYDDSTFALVLGSELATNFEGGAQGVILSSEGIVTAPPVNKDMNVTLIGSYAGLSASSILNVLDVYKDNWGALAGDGFPDDWESRMGVTSALSKAGDNDGDGRNNALEYVLNSNPIVVNSGGYSVIGQVSQGGWNYLTVSVARNKAVSSTAVYQGRESFDLTRWVRHTDSPAITSSADPYTELVTVTAVFPIGYTQKGFLAMEITIPDNLMPTPALSSLGISVADRTP